MHDINYIVFFFLFSLVVASLVHQPILHFARKYNIYDNPDERKLQREPIPVMGGFVVFIGCMAGILSYWLIRDCTSIIPVEVAMLIMMLVGAYDDRCLLSPYQKFTIEIILVVALTLINDYPVNDFHGLFGINHISPWIAWPLTVVACVGIINAINMIDGIDGLSSGMCILILGLFSWMFFISHDWPRAALGCTLIGGLIPFFILNVFGDKSKMFIGDAGTLMLGIVISDMVMAMLTEGSKVESRVLNKEACTEAFALAVLAVPVFDTIRVMFGRIFRGKSPFLPDKTHLHHAFIDYGFHHLETSLLEIFLNMLIVLVWFVLGNSYFSKEWQLIGVIAAGSISNLGLYWMLGRRRRFAAKRELVERRKAEKMPAKALTVAVLLTTGYTAASAQQLQAKLSHYSTEDGLASNAIQQIVQDDYGYIWLATWNGLSRFDGYDFFNYRTGTLSHIPHLHNHVFHIAVDNQQNIWMRMYDNRVFVLKRSIDQIINPFADINGSDEYRSSFPIVVTSSGDVLITVDDIGIYKMRMTGDGLSSQLITTAGLTVTSMAEGYQNDIWLGTNAGIHRMDASNMTIERKGLFTDEYVNCLFSNGYNIYAGTRSGKIVSFSYGQEPVTIRQGGEAVSAMFVDSHGLIWFADNGSGISCLNTETHQERRFTQTVTVPDYDSWGCHFAETNGTVWMSMNHGGYGYFDRERDEVSYFHNDPTNPWNLSNTCNASLELNEGVVWESTSRRGLEKLEIMNNNIERRLLVPGSEMMLDNEILGLCYDPKHKLLMMANKNNTLFTITDDGSRTAYTKSDNGVNLGRIYGITRDSEETFWLSSKDNGLFKMTPKDGGGFSIVNYRHHDDDPQSLGDDHAYQTVEDNDGNIWIATYGGGVNLLPKGTTTFLTPKNKMKSYPRNAYQKVRTVALDKDGKVWAGTTDGILIMSYKDGHVTIDKLEPSEEQPDAILHSNDVVCMGRDNQGMMWVGTNGGGLSHTTGIDNDGRWLFENFGAKDGLPSEEIRSLTFDNRGSVWFATEHVICSFDRGKRIFSTFSTLEGVDETICSEGSALSLPDGNLIFGTINGYYIVDRDKLVNTPGTMLKLHFTDFWVDGLQQSPRLSSLYDYYVPDAKEVEIPSHNSSFAIRFASLNYQLQHRVHYQYKLEGYDHNWINAGNDRKASYKNIPSGTYHFYVRAFLLESPEKYDQKDMVITVPPMFMLSKNAIWLYILLIAAAGIAMLFMRQRQLLKQAKSQSGRSSKDNRKHLPEEQQLMAMFTEWLDKRYAVHDLVLDEFLASAQMNRANFENTLRSITGLSPREFINDFRIRKAKEMLEQTSDSVADISFNCGFTDPVQFNRLFNAKTGMTPSQYRDKHHDGGETDSYEL